MPDVMKQGCSQYPQLFSFVQNVLKVIDLFQHCCEYQCRAVIFDVDSFMFGPEQGQMKIYRFGIGFGDPKKPTYAIIYAPERVCGTRAL